RARARARDQLTPLERPSVGTPVRWNARPLDSHQERVAVMTPSAQRFRERAVEADRLLRMQPRWLAPVTWRLVGMALLVAVALVARHVWDALTSGEVPLGHYWPGALLHVNAYVVAA